MALRLTLGFSDNPRVQPLKDGIVKPQGIELDCRGQGQRLVQRAHESAEPWGRAGPGHGRGGGRHPMGTDYGHHDHAAHLDGLRNLRTAGGISARVYDKIVDAKPRAAYAL